MTGRTEFSRKVKMERWTHCGGRCEGVNDEGERCNVKLYPGDYDFDHDNPDGLTGEATFENCRVLCKSCHGAKTKKDRERIDKAKRVESFHVTGQSRERKGRPIPGSKRSGWKAQYNRDKGRFEMVKR